MKTELFNQNPWWEKKFEEKTYKRKIYLEKIFKNMNEKDVIFLMGLRRIGKTTIIRQAISKLLEKIKPSDICFVSLDSFNFIDFSIHDIVEEYRKIHKKSRADFFYLFLDEVTCKKDFSLELKSLYDNDNIKIICSSSIATLMYDKKAYLTGRTKTIEVMPLTFREFLEFKDVKIYRADKAKLEAYFEEYMGFGGIPKYVETKDREYLKELVDSIIYKDIISQYNVSDEKVIRELFVLLCERVGKPMSYNKLSNILKVSVNSVKRYVSYFEKAYLFYSVDRWSKSFNENITSPKKVYVGDVGIKNMVTGFRDLGASYENLVFLKIKNEEPRYFLENKIEIDFRTENCLIEAKYGLELSEDQKKLFDRIKIKKKIIAKGVGYFNEENKR